MQIEEYERMFRHEGEYWWFVGRRNLVLALLRDWLAERSDRLFLDAGCGTGAMLKALEPWGQIVGVDFSEEALHFCQKRGCDRLVQSVIDRLPCPDDTFDLITLLDVLEHLEDDRSALYELIRVLKPGGRLVISVPAYHFLWSGHDVALMHKRRYIARRLRERLLQVGFEIQKLSYAVMLLFPIVLFFRLKDRWFRRGKPPEASIMPLPGWVNHLLIGFQSLEARLIRRFNLPFGVSLIAIVTKPHA